MENFEIKIKVSPKEKEAGKFDVSFICPLNINVLRAYNIMKEQTEVILSVIAEYTDGKTKEERDKILESLIFGDLKTN